MWSKAEIIFVWGAVTFPQSESIITVRADFQQGMESVS